MIRKLQSAKGKIVLTSSSIQNNKLSEWTHPNADRLGTSTSVLSNVRTYVSHMNTCNSYIAYINGKDDVVIFDISLYFLHVNEIEWTLALSLCVRLCLCAFAHMFTVRSHIAEHSLHHSYMCGMTFILHFVYRLVRSLKLDSIAHSIS